MARPKRSEAESNYISQQKEVFIARFNERAKTLGYTQSDVANKMLDFYKDKIDANCSKKFLNNVKSWCSNTKDKETLPDFTSLYVLSNVLKCDSGYLMGTQDKPRKDMEEYARNCGIQYESAISFAEFFSNQEYCRSVDLINYCLIKQPSALIDFMDNLFTALEQTEVYKYVKTHSGHDENWVNNRHGYVYNVSDYSPSEYHYRMSLLEEWLRSHAAFQGVTELALEYSIYRHHYPYNYHGSNTIDKQALKELETKHFTKKESKPYYK